MADVEIVKVTGTLLVGVVLDCFLFGALCVQLYFYYQAFPGDRWWVKTLVYVACAIESAKTISIIDSAFAQLGYGFANPTSISKVPIAWIMVPIAGALVGFAAQCFYAYRIRVLSGGILIPGIIIAISLTSSGSALIYSAFNSKMNTILLQSSDRTFVALVVWCGASALCDIFNRHLYDILCGATGLRQTRAMVSRLTRLIIETGILTALVATITLVLFIAFPQNIYYSVGGGILPTLYANTVLLILNSRIKIVGGRGTNNAEDMMALSSPTFSSAARPNLGAEQAAVVTIPHEALSETDLPDEVEMKVMSHANDTAV
ncbi:hypothetical protein FB45DRAFT_1020314 [Roridomyces roridus]|uniref:DUF6534 domain-containing protein n=1 Tax=Roridomyces roridus TaxID=1738132 RepID=A0AAD7CGL5_9AGAR|nr:hypothetical protein FB45DRAFT_1020314 [Roridomyces roridus]